MTIKLDLFGRDDFAKIRRSRFWLLLVSLTFLEEAFVNLNFVLVLDQK